MDIFANLKNVVKRREVVIDNEVFQLHYRVAALLLIGCAALVASKQHFGDPIDCITKDDVPNKIMDTYCWIHATFTLPDACNKTVGIEVSFMSFLAPVKRFACDSPSLSWARPARQPREFPKLHPLVKSESVVQPKL